MPRKPGKEKPEKIEKIEKEESELEEDIEEAEEEIEDSRFAEFLQPVRSRAPVLERTMTGGEIPNLEIGVAEANGFGNEKREDDSGGFKYLAGKSQEEPKYFSSGEGREIIHSPSPVELAGLGKNRSWVGQQDVSLSTSPESRMINAEGHMKYELPDRFDVEKAGKGNVFEKKDIKYKPSR